MLADHKFEGTYYDPIRLVASSPAARGNTGAANSIFVRDFEFVSTPIAGEAEAVMIFGRAIQFVLGNDDVSPPTAANYRSEILSHCGGYEEKVLLGAQRVLTNDTLQVIELETVTSVQTLLADHKFEGAYYNPFNRKLSRHRRGDTRESIPSSCAIWSLYRRE